GMKLRAGEHPEIADHGYSARERLDRERITALRRVPGAISKTMAALHGNANWFLVAVIKGCLRRPRIVLQSNPHARLLQERQDRKRAAPVRIDKNVHNFWEKRSWIGKSLSRQRRCCLRASARTLPHRKSTLIKWMRPF